MTQIKVNKKTGKKVATNHLIKAVSFRGKRVVFAWNSFYLMGQLSEGKSLYMTWTWPVFHHTKNVVHNHWHSAFAWAHRGRARDQFPPSTGIPKDLTVYQHSFIVQRTVICTCPKANRRRMSAGTRRPTSDDVSGVGKTWFAFPSSKDTCWFHWQIRAGATGAGAPTPCIRDELSLMECCLRKWTKEQKYPRKCVASLVANDFQGQIWEGRVPTLSRTKATRHGEAGTSPTKWFVMKYPPLSLKTRSIPRRTS